MEELALNGEIYDIDKDGNEDLFLVGVDAFADIGWINIGRAYNNITAERLPTEISFDFIELYQINDPTFGDFNGDQQTDWVYFRF